MQPVRLVIGTAAVLLFFGTMIPVYAQRGEGGGKQEGKQQEHAQQAQPQQRAQQAQPQQRAQQAQPQRAQQAQPQRAEQPKQQQQPQRAQQQQPQQRTEQPRQQQVQQQPQQREQPRQQAQQYPQRGQRQYQPPQRAPEQARSWQQQRGWAQNGAWQGQTSFEQSRSRNWASDHRTWAQRGGYGGYYIPQDRFTIYFGSQHFFRLRSRPVIYMGYPRFSYNGFSFLIVDPWPEYWSYNWYDSDDVYVDYDYDDCGYYLYNRHYPAVRLAISVVL